jgi:hypothetical protein
MSLDRQAYEYLSYVAPWVGLYSMDHYLDRIGLDRLEFRPGVEKVFLKFEGEHSLILESGYLHHG